jgi:predicted negative regulator of RcsB-dependent stress response
VVVLVVAVVGFAGYRVWSNQNTADTTETSATTTVPSTIQTKADLDSTGKYLDGLGAQLNADLDDSSLNADINSML